MIWMWVFFFPFPTLDTVTGVPSPLRYVEKVLPLKTRHAWFYGFFHLFFALYNNYEGTHWAKPGGARATWPTRRWLKVCKKKKKERSKAAISQVLVSFEDVLIPVFSLELLWWDPSFRYVLFFFFSLKARIIFSPLVFPLLCVQVGKRNLHLTAARLAVLVFSVCFSRPQKTGGTWRHFC